MIYPFSAEFLDSYRAFNRMDNRRFSHENLKSASFNCKKHNNKKSNRRFR